MTGWELLEACECGPYRLHLPEKLQANYRYNYRGSKNGYFYPDNILNLLYFCL